MSKEMYRDGGRMIEFGSFDELIEWAKKEYGSGFEVET